MSLFKLPNKILFLIAEELKPSCLNSFIKTNHWLRDILTPRLTHVMLYHKNEILLWAAERGRIHLARLLLDNGADVNYRDTNQTPVVVVAANRCGAEVKLGPARGIRYAPPGSSRPRVNRSAENNDHGEIIKLLLERGAKLPAGDGLLTIGIDLALANVGLGGMDAYWLSVSEVAGGGKAWADISLACKVGANAQRARLWVSIVILLLERGMTINCYYLWCLGAFGITIEDGMPETLAKLSTYA